MRKIKKTIKKRFGRKGLKFTGDVIQNTFTTKNMVSLGKSVKHGMLRFKEKREAEYEELAKCEYVKELKDYVLTISCFTYGALVIYGMYDKEDPRIKEIQNRVLPLKDKIYEEIDNGEYEFIYNLDDEKNRSAAKIFEQIFVNRIFIMAGLTSEEGKLFWSKLTELTIGNRPYADDFS